MSFANTINELIDKPTGGRFIKLRNTGDAIVGNLIDIEERIKMYEGTPVLSRKTGKPRTEWVITLEVPEADPSIDDDDRIRRIAAGETLQAAIRDHMRETGQHFPAKFGGRLAIVVKKGAESATNGVDFDGWDVRYQPPSGADAINNLMAAGTAATPSAADLFG